MDANPIRLKGLSMKNWLLISISYLIISVANATPLPAAEVFQVDVKKLDPNTFTVNWQIKPNYFLYADRIHVKVDNNPFIQSGSLRLPVSVNKTDKQGHTFPVYRNQLSVPVAILGKQAGETLIDLNYQGCSDDGFCYPPETQKIKIAINTQLELSSVTLEQSSLPSETTSTKRINQISKTSSTDLSEIFSKHGWVFILLTFYGFGLLLAFTPCILPMVPVLSGIIIGHGKDITTKKAFFLSLSYVLSMSITYALIGGLVATIGSNLQIAMQSPWIIGLFSLVFVVLALSMFGFYEFKLPDAWQSKIAGSSRKQRGGHFIGAAIMGCLSTLILSPCVTAPLIGVLTYIAQTGNIMLGGLTLFFLSLGMGTPLLLVGTSAGKWLPETGSWMNAVKTFFGILLLAVAIYLVDRILPASIIMALWGSLLIFSGVYAGALTYSVTSQEKMFQSLGIILLGYGLLILVGASMGSTNPLQPLVTGQTNLIAQPKPQNQKKQTLKLIKQKIKEAKGTPVMLDFYADWCASCKVMDATTFKDPRIIDTLAQFTVIKIDVTKNSSSNKAIMNYFHVIAPPTFVFYNSEGKLLKHLQVVGESSAYEFLKTLNTVNYE